MKAADVLRDYVLHFKIFIHLSKILNCSICAIDSIKPVKTIAQLISKTGRATEKSLALTYKSEICFEWKNPTSFQLTQWHPDSIIMKLMNLSFKEDGNC